jgi:hypothetical protein
MEFTTLIHSNPYWRHKMSRPTNKKELLELAELKYKGTELKNIAMDRNNIFGFLLYFKHVKPL